MKDNEDDPGTRSYASADTPWALLTDEQAVALDLALQGHRHGPWPDDPTGTCHDLLIKSYRSMGHWELFTTSWHLPRGAVATLGHLGQYAAALMADGTWRLRRWPYFDRTEMGQDEDVYRSYRILFGAED